MPSGRMTSLAAGRDAFIPRPHPTTLPRLSRNHGVSSRRLPTIPEFSTLDEIPMDAADTRIKQRGLFVTTEVCLPEVAPRPFIVPQTFPNPTVTTLTRPAPEPIALYVGKTHFAIANQRVESAPIPASSLTLGLNASANANANASANQHQKNSSAAPTNNANPDIATLARSYLPTFQSHVLDLLSRMPHTRDLAQKIQSILNVSFDPTATKHTVQFPEMHDATSPSLTVSASVSPGSGFARLGYTVAASAPEQVLRVIGFLNGGDRRTSEDNYTRHQVWEICWGEDRAPEGCVVLAVEVWVVRPRLAPATSFETRYGRWLRFERQAKVLRGVLEQVKKNG